MTFKKFQSLFLTKYPDGEVFPHDVFCHGESGKIQKVGVVFKPNGKVFMYRGAYEDILCKIGINVISKERFHELEIRLDHLKGLDGTTDEFFGGLWDCANAIQKLESQIAEYKANWIIA